HRDELWSESGPLSLFRHQNTRFVLRNTRLYRTLLDQSLQPEYLQSEHTFEQYFEDLIQKLPAQAYGWFPDRVWRSEIAALKCLDVPMFTAPVDSKTLFADDGQSIDGAIRESGYDSVKRIIGSLGEEDLRRQMALIRMSFHA